MLELIAMHTASQRYADYTKMMELVDDFGHTVFETIKITLVSVRSIDRTVASTS